MAQGKYAKPSQKGSGNRGLWITLVILVLLLVGTILFILASGILSSPKQPPVQTQASTTPETLPEETLVATEATRPTTEATEPATEATEETTEATEETTEATTEATEATQATTKPAPSDKGEAVAELAREQVGKPYLLGGNGPEAFDTTGFIYYCFRENGISAPRRLAEQAAYGVEVALEDLQPGDVMFFWTSNPGEVEYPAIYVGNGMIVAARNEAHPVTEMNSTYDYYTERFLLARRYY